MRFSIIEKTRKEIVKMSHKYNHFSTRRDNSLAVIFAGVLACSIICLCIASSYLYVANTHDIIWEHAKLYDAAVKKEVSSRSCTTHKDSYGNSYQTCTTYYKYHIQEFFEKAKIENGTYVLLNDYTVVNRLTEYTYSEAADNQLQKTKLGTYRKLYLSAMSGYTGTAYDQAIIDYYHTVGYVLMCFFGVTFGGIFAILIMVALNDWKENFYVNHPELKQTDHFLNMSDAALANATNMSCACMPRWWNLFWKFADTDESGVISFCEFFTALGSVFASLMRSLCYAFMDLGVFLWETLCYTAVFLSACCCAMCVASAAPSNNTSYVSHHNNDFGVSHV